MGLGIVDHLWRRFARFKLSAHFLDLRSLLFELGRENLYLFLLLRGRCLQVLNFAVQHGFAVGLWNRFGLGGLGRKWSSSDYYRAQSSIGIDQHEPSYPAHVVNVRTIDVLDIADVIFLAKATVHTRPVANDDIVIGGGDTIPGVST